MQPFMARFLPFIFLGILLVLVVMGFILFSYLLIFGAIIGFILFVAAQVKRLFFHSNQNPPPEQQEKRGRIIDHDPRK